MDLCQWGFMVLCTTALVNQCDIIYLWWFAAEFGTCNVLLNAVPSLLFCYAKKTYILNPNQHWLLNNYFLLFYIKSKALFCNSCFLVDQLKISSMLWAFGPVLEKHSVYLCDVDCDNDTLWSPWLKKGLKGAE